mmetsp:Transcript_45493/g.99060  ORF Transcript_45493/g.99060 Transcript_45493/m.99060 type:complete len:204 (+) Transcript_45493:1-612(+)
MCAESANGKRACRRVSSAAPMRGLSAECPNYQRGNSRGRRRRRRHDARVRVRVVGRAFWQRGRRAGDLRQRHERERVQPLLLLVRLHLGERHQPADMPALQSVRRALPRLTLAAAKVVARAQQRRQLCNLLSANFLQVAIRQELSGDGAVVEEAERAARPHITQKDVDATEVCFLSRLSQRGELGSGLLRRCRHACGGGKGNG